MRSPLDPAFILPGYGFRELLSLEARERARLVEDAAERVTTQPPTLWAWAVTLAVLAVLAVGRPCLAGRGLPFKVRLHCAPPAAQAPPWHSCRNTTHAVAPARTALCRLGATNANAAIVRQGPTAGQGSAPH
jgi:hypothetical protein